MHATTTAIPPALRIAAILTVAAVVLATCAATAAHAAENLRLAPGLSFGDDSSAAFPIEGAALDAADLGAGRPTVIFFGAAHCWNTNREAERLVAVYPRFRDTVRFVVVDVARPSPAQRALVREHYAGYIPTVVVLAPDGKVLYSRAGETASTRGDSAALARLIEQSLGR